MIKYKHNSRTFKDGIYYEYESGTSYHSDRRLK